MPWDGTPRNAENCERSSWGCRGPVIKEMVDGGREGVDLERGRRASTRTWFFHGVSRSKFRRWLSVLMGSFNYVKVKIFDHTRESRGGRGLTWNMSGGRRPERGSFVV